MELPSALFADEGMFEGLASGGHISIKNVRMFDGQEMRVGSVDIDNGRIISMDREVSGNGCRIDCGGSDVTLLPGLIDSHVHLYREVSLAQSLAFGVTYLLDMFADPAHIKYLKDVVERGKREGSQLPDLLSAGFTVTCKNGHCTEYGFDVPTIEKPEDAQQFVDSRIEEGSDYIKIIYDGGRGRFRKIRSETLQESIKAARRRGRLSIVHAMCLQDAKEALAARADGLAHLFVDMKPDEEFVRMASNAGSFVVPTMTVLASLCGMKVHDTGRMQWREYISCEDKQFDPMGAPSHLKLYSNAEETVKRLVDAKVPILAGTDALNDGTWYGVSLHKELELLVKAGMKPVDALASATSLPADIFRLGSMGRIKEGMNADLLLVRGDPSRNITATQDILLVMKGGKAVDRKRLAKIR